MARRKQTMCQENQIRRQKVCTLYNIHILEAYILNIFKLPCRYIIAHAGHIDGFIPDASLIFSSNPKNFDYHGEMNHENFIHWLENQLLIHLEEPSMIIMDNALSCKLAIQCPTTNWKKEIIQNWLINNKISFDADMLKIQLLHLVSL